VQCLGGAGLRTLVAEDALRSVFSFAVFLVDLHVHGTDPQAFSTVDALLLVAVDAQQGKIAHRLEEHRDGTQIFAERPVVLACECQRDACGIVKRVSGEEQPEHDLLQVRGFHQKESGYQCQRQGEHDIAQHAQLFFSRLLRLLVGQEVQHHGRPAGIAAPAAPEQQRAEDLRHRVVNGRCLKYAEEQTVPEPLDLHILVGDDAEVQQHIAAHRQLHEMAGVAFPGGKQCRPQSEAGSDVAEIQQVEQIVLREPQCDCHRLKQQEQQCRRHVFARSVIAFHRISFALPNRVSPRSTIR